MSLRPRPILGYACNIVLTKGCFFLMASWCVCKIWRNLIQKSRFSPDLRSYTHQIYPPRNMIKRLIVHRNNGRCFPFTTGNTIFNPEFISLKPACWFTRYVEAQPRSAGEISHWRVSNPFRHRAGRAPATLGEVGCFCVELEDRNGSYLGCNL